MAGAEMRALGHEYGARMFLDKAELNHDSLVAASSASLRSSFAEFVEGLYERVEDACDSGDQEEANAAVRALQEGCDAFRALVKERVREVSVQLAELER
jgi:methanogenic corrinoid protein MtbC1